MRRIKILYVVTTLGLGGVQEHIRLLTQKMDTSLFDIWITYGPPGDKVPDFKGMGITLVELGLVKRISPFKDLVSLWKLWRLMKRERFDIVHAHMAKAGLLGRLAAKLAGVKVVLMTGHGWSGHLDNYFSNTLAQKLFHLIEWVWGFLFTDGIILLTNEDFDEIRKQNLYAEKKLFLVPNGINVCELKKRSLSGGDIRKALNCTNDTFLVTMIGRICKVKATWVYAEAARRILSERENIHFLLVGEGPDEEKICTIKSKMPRKENFHMLGLRKDVPAILGTSDIFVLTSITEGMAITLLEAMALGLAVVATDIPGNRALVENGKTGLLVPPNKPEAVSRAVLKLLDNVSQRNRLGENAKNLIQQKFASRKMVEETAGIYIKLLKKKEIPSQKGLEKQTTTGGITH